MDRIHRLGQHRPVKVHRIVVENSIESRILELQQKKQLLFDSTVGYCKEAVDDKGAVQRADSLVWLTVVWNTLSYFMFSMQVGMDAKALNRLSEEDMKFLFVL